jgi:chromosome segregation ATPase
MQFSLEELKSTNEELQSTNEELQSTNEELTTSREEMQSLNEELQTVNTEQMSIVPFLPIRDKNTKIIEEVMGMVKDKSQSTSAVELRRKAEERLRAFSVCSNLLSKKKNSPRRCVITWVQRIVRPTLYSGFLTISST